MELKEKVKNTVADYIRMYPEEYKALVAVVVEDRKKLMDEKFASSNKHERVGGTVKREHALERALYTISETLDSMLINTLTVEEMTEFKSKENARWFARQFPEFRLPLVV